MTKSDLSGLLPIEKFREERVFIEETLKDLNSDPISATDLCSLVVRLYLTIAKNASDEQIKKDAMREARYFSKRSKEYWEKDSNHNELIPVTLSGSEQPDYPNPLRYEFA